MSNTPREVKEIREQLAVIRSATETVSSVFKKTQETVDIFNVATTKQAKITIRLTAIMVIAAMLSAWAAISTFNLTNRINAPNVGLAYNNETHDFIFRNYGELPAKDVRIFWKHISFGEGEVLEEGRSEIDYIYGDDFVVIPRQKMMSDKNTHFLIYVWQGNAKEIRKRAFLYDPFGYGWIITTKNLIAANQWSVLTKHFNELEAKIR